MAAKAREPIQERELTGLNYLNQISSLLERLRPVGCARDKAGNRELFFDQYCGLILLYMFNPIVGSLRGMQQVSELKKVQRKLACPRASLGSLSEAARVFDPELLREIVGELIDRAPLSAERDPRLKDFAHTLTAVDGSLLKTLPQVTQACFATRRDKGWKLHTHFEILKGVPVKMAVTDATGKGPANEKTYSADNSNRIAATSKTAATRTSRCSTTSSPPAAVTCAAFEETTILRPTKPANSLRKHPRPV